MPDYLVGCGEFCEPHQLLEYLLTLAYSTPKGSAV